MANFILWLWNSQALCFSAMRYLHNVEALKKNRLRCGTLCF